MLHKGGALLVQLLNFFVIQENICIEGITQENIVLEEGGSGLDLGWKKTSGPLQLLARSSSVLFWIYETQETGMHGGRTQTNPGTLTSRWSMV